MKKLLGCVGFILIIIIAGATMWYVHITNQYKTYSEQNPDILVNKIIFSSQVSRSFIREAITKTKNPSINSILNGIYNYITKQTQSYLTTKSTTGTIEESIQTDTHIITINRSQPERATQYIDIQYGSGRTGWQILFEEQPAGNILLYTTSWRTAEEAQWLLNRQKIYASWDFVIAFAQSLDNPFSWTNTEIYGDIVYTINNAIQWLTISDIQQITYTLAYIQSINGSGNIITIDPIIWFDGEAANQAFAQYEPEQCANILSGTNQTQCIVPNGYYIYNATNTGDSMSLNYTPETDIQVIDKTDDQNQTMSIEYEKFVENNAVYSNIPFHVYYDDKNNIIQMSEQYIP